MPFRNAILSFYLPSMLPSKLPSIKTALLLCIYFQHLPPPPSDSNSSSSSSPTPTTPPPPFSPIYPVRVKMLVDSPTVVYIDDSFAHITVEYTGIASVVSANTVSFCGNIFSFNCGQEKSSKDLAALASLRKTSLNNNINTRRRRQQFHAKSQYNCSIQQEYFFPRNSRRSSVRGFHAPDVL